jgi:hypothetical protein
MSGKAYPRPTYNPPLSIFNPIFFPQVFPTTSSGGGGGGQTNDFPSGILTGNTITCYSTTGTDRNIYGISLLEFSDSTTNDYTDITTTMELTGSTLTIENTNTSSVINFVADSVEVNGVAIATGGNVSTDISNNFLVGTTQTFDGAIVVDNTQSNIGQLSNGNGTNTAIGNGSLGGIGNANDNSSFGYHSLLNLTTGQQNTSVGKSCLSALTSGLGNTSVGWSSLSDCLTNNYNIGIGTLAGYSLSGGDNNTFVGYQAGGYQTSGNNNVAIGYLAGVSPTSPTISDTIAIGNQVYADNVGDMVLGVGGGNFNSTNFPYYALITPNTTDNGIQIQGTYNDSSNFTIDSLGKYVYLKGTNIELNASNTISISNILQSPNDPTIDPNILANGRGTFYVSSQLPYFAYNNAGTITSQQLLTSTSSTNILGTYTSSPCDTSFSPTAWAFDTIPNTLGNQFSFIIYSNTAPTTTNPTLFFTNSVLNSNYVSDYILAVGTAILIPFQYSDNGTPPVITNTSGYLFTAPTSIGGIRFNPVVVNATSTGTTYQINATSTTLNPITNGSTLTLVAYNSYF